jgi:HD-GYP domain-containing protein (c-di-GMP phosphodiesterase class II)
MSDFSKLTPELPELRRRSISPAFLVVLVLIVAALGGALVLRFVHVQEQREVLVWQKKLNLIADSRVAEVDDWLEMHFKELGSVASNPSLQLYLMELMNNGATNGPAPAAVPAEEPAQAVFLRNLLSITADRLGFIEKPSAELTSINANVHPQTGVGLILVDLKGKTLVSTVGLPVLDDGLAQKVDAFPKGQQALIDIYATDDGAKRIGFAVPLFPVQSDNLAEQQIGWLIGVKAVDDGLFRRLRHPGVTDKTLEAVLVRKDGDNITYLSPQEGDARSVSKLAVDTPDLDAAFAVQAPGDFAVKKDSEAHVTLMTSRAVHHAPWVVLLHIDRDQALGESDVWLRQVEFTLFFGVLAFIGGLVAVWFYGTSRRLKLQTLETRRMAVRSAAQEKLLTVVTDNQLEPIVIVDQQNIAHFANAKAAQTFHMTVADVAGKDMTALVGPAYASGYVDANREALATSKPVVRTWKLESQGVNRVMRSEHIPLEHVPVEGLTVPSPGVLMIDQDITQIVNERERRTRTMRQLVDMLVHMVDKRDPFAAKHSSCVAAVARAVAVSMGLDDVLVDTADIAGKLLNVGKIIVPSAVLTKPSSLTIEEREAIRESLHSSIALLKNVDFDGPVIATLQQAQERFDGAGPLKLAGDDILITARIIAAANAFIGMISPRSYRQSLGVEWAIKSLLEEMDTQFDRRVVLSLSDYIENKGGKSEVARLIAG